MSIKKKKISELESTSSLDGFVTLGYKEVDGENQSRKIDLSLIGDAADNANEAAETANTAAQTANTAAEAADEAREGIQSDLAGKADKDGYSPNAHVGLADDLDADGDSVEANDQHFTSMRTTAGSASVSTGVAQLNNVKGQLVKQLLSNGNFADGTTDWTTYGALTYEVVDGKYLHITKPTPATERAIYSSQIAAVSGHRYIAFARIISNDSAFPNQFGGISPRVGTSVIFNHIDKKWLVDGDWDTVATMFVCPEEASLITIGVSGGKSYTDLKIDCEFGVQLYDLTELGLASTLTTAQQCLDYFGYGYVEEGVQGTDLTSVQASAYNQFDKTTNVMAGKGINSTTGAIEDVAGHSVIWCKCVKGVSGTGNNNGYRIVDTVTAANVVRAGFSYFEPTSAAFDKATALTEFSANYIDYLPSDIGYIVAEVVSPLNICIGLKWSYNDERLAELQGAYGLYTLNMPTLTEPLRGLRNSSGVLTADELDLKNKQLIRRVVKYTFTGAESLIGHWAAYGYVAGFALSDINPNNITIGQCNVYTFYLNAGGIVEVDKICSFGSGYVFFRDTAYSTISAFQAHLAELYAAGTPLEVYYVLATPVVTALPASTVNTYLESDMGTEMQVVANNVYPASISTEYFASFKDSMNNLLDKTTEVDEIVLAEALAAHEADIAGIDVDNLGDAHARNLDLDNLPTLCTFPIKRIETDTPSALSAVPEFVGQEYYDTTNKKKYEAFGTSSVNDWVVIN